MNAENYVRFVKTFNIFSYNSKFHPENVSNFGNSGESFMNNIAHTLPKCKVFEIENSIKKMLILTDPPNKDNEDLKLPFDNIFIDVDFTQEELENLGIEIDAKAEIGIMLQKGTMVADAEKIEDKTAQELDGDYKELCESHKEEKIIVGNALRCTILSINGDEFWFDTFTKNINIFDEYKGFQAKVVTNPTTDPKMRDFVHKFAVNFLNFLHNPEVILVEHKVSEKNLLRRQKNGKILIPTRYSVNVTGTLKKYIDEISEHKNFHYSHRFWVRGHFRHLTAERYKEKKVIWILPYIKGDGLLIEKIYKVEKKGETEDDKN
jgi:hypothetical protein